MISKVIKYLKNKFKKISTYPMNISRLLLWLYFIFLIIFFITISFKRVRVKEGPFATCKMSGSVIKIALSKFTECLGHIEKQKFQILAFSIGLFWE